MFDKQDILNILIWIGIVVDGWDRTNFDYSFNQQRITEKEFKQRVVRSTTQGRLPND